MATGEDLRQFLTSHGCFNGFCTAIEEQHGVSFNEVIDGRRTFSGVIDASITWDETTEGSDFWCDLNDQWIKACKSGIFNELGLNCNDIWRQEWKVAN